MNRTFLYRFEDGTEVEHGLMSAPDMNHLIETHGACTYNGWAEFMGVGQPSRLGVIGGSNSRGDAFRTGYNPALGMEIRSPSHFKQVLKEKGLREVGTEKPRDPGVKKKSYISEEIVKQAIESGANITGQEADKLVKGESLSE